jgi:hypothetical protein
VENTLTLKSPEMSIDAIFALVRRQFEERGGNRGKGRSIQVLMSDVDV